MNLLEKNILKIDDILFSKAIKMENPVIEHDLGALLYFSTKYNYSNEFIYKEKALDLFEKLLDIFSEFDFQTGLLEGFDGIGWVLTYMKKCNIIDSDELLKDVDDFLIQSIRLNINTNNFDLLYGSIGKIQFLIDSERYKEKQIIDLIDGIVNKLYETRIEKNKRIYWYDLDSEKINLGLSHGLASIFIFLLKLQELNFKNKNIKKMILGIIKSYAYFENKIPGISSFGASFPYTRNDTSHSRLAWCYGDLGIAYSFLYADTVLKNQNTKIKYNDMLNLLLQREISDSGLVHFYNYSFFDTGFCHGLSGIYYILFKMNEMEPNLILQKKIKYWEDELLKNLNIQLSIEGDIVFPETRQGTDEIYKIEKETMLNGLCGVGLVLLTMKYKKADWSNFFLLY